LAQTLQNAWRVYQAELEVAIANQQREELARQREDFVSRLTHDMQTPLVAANRMLTLFLEGVYGDTSPEMQSAIPVIIRSNENLLQMVNNLLEVYCHDSGYKQLNFIPCDLSELLQEVIQALMPLAQEKELVLTSHIEKAVNSHLQSNTTVLGDRLELRRVFINLVGNAIKFTDEGVVSLHLTGADSPQGLVTLEIQDTGPGISPDDQATLFERFRQGKHRRSKSGLGLYLSRRIVEAHQGTITVRTEVGKGSTFTVFLPAHLN
jgi:signal transduction histidine kinase